MKISVFTTLVVLIFAEQLTVLQHAVVLFQPLNNAVYTEKQKSIINIKLPSPRVKLNYLCYTSCFICDDLEVIDQCEPQFADFDDKILQFLSHNLVRRNINKPTQKMNYAKVIMEATKEHRSRFCFRRHHEMKFEKNYTIPTPFEFEQQFKKDWMDVTLTWQPTKKLQRKNILMISNENTKYQKGTAVVMT